MAGGGSGDIPKFTGLAKYFNTHTIDGRSNIVTATLGTAALLFLYLKFRPSKK